MGNGYPSGIQGMLTLTERGEIREGMVAKKGGENNYMDYLGFILFIMHK